MANFDTETQRKTGFFHALGLVLTKKTNEPANEIYKSAHNVQTREIWVDEIGYVQLFSEAETEASTNDAVTQRGDEGSGTVSMALLYPMKDTDRQSWFLDTATPSFDTNGFVPSTGWVKPYISIVDAPNTAGAPSTGYALRLYTPAGTQISALQGRWEVDYFAGILKFAEGYTPTDTGNGLGFDFDVNDFLSAGNKISYLQQNGPFAISFEYTGEFLDGYITTNLEEFTYKVNSQRGITSSTTYVPYDIGMEETIQFEPTGDKSVDVLVNGVEVPTSLYRWGAPGTFTPLTLITTGTNSITIPNAEVPTIGEYLQLDNGVSNFHRQVSTFSSGSTLSVATYSGINVAGTTSANQFTITTRSEAIGHQGDYLLWIGTDFYELETGGYYYDKIAATMSPDYITLEYITQDPGALNL